MKYSMLVAAGLVLASLVVHTPEAQAQNAVERKLIEVQREVFDLKNAINASREGDNEKVAQLDALIRQAIDATHALSGELERLQKNLTQSVTEQQTRVAEPLAVMKAGLEQVSQDTGALRTSIDNLNQRISKSETTLDEILKLVRTLNIPPPAPPAPEINSAQAADALFVGALRDMAGGNDDLALQGFGAFATQFMDDPRAPEALYSMGAVYVRLQRYDDAIKAFDSVVERYGEIPFASRARFAKADALMKAGKRPEALREFRAFLEKHPDDANAATARARVRELGGR